MWELQGSIPWTWTMRRTFERAIGIDEIGEMERGCGAKESIIYLISQWHF